MADVSFVFAGRTYKARLSVGKTYNTILYGLSLNAKLDTVRLVHGPGWVGDTWSDPWQRPLTGALERGMSRPWVSSLHAVFRSVA